MFLEAFPRQNHCCPVLHLAVSLVAAPPQPLSASAVLASGKTPSSQTDVGLCLLRCAAKFNKPREQSQHSPPRTEAAVTPPSSAPLVPLAAVPSISQNTQATLQLCTVEIKPPLIPAAARVELQRCTPCYAHHKLTQFEIYRNKDIPGTFQCHGLKLRGWPNANILCVERNDVYNLKPAQGLVTHGLSMAGSTAWCRASSNPPEV